MDKYLSAVINTVHQMHHGTAVFAMMNPTYCMLLNNYQQKGLLDLEKQMLSLLKLSLRFKSGLLVVWSIERLKLSIGIGIGHSMRSQIDEQYIRLPSF